MNQQSPMTSTSAPNASEVGKQGGAVARDYRDREDQPLGVEEGRDEHHSGADPARRLVGRRPCPPQLDGRQDEIGDHEALEHDAGRRMNVDQRQQEQAGW